MKRYPNLPCSLAIFLTISWASAQSVPSPESVLGFKPGADFKLASYDQSIAYFQQLDEASDRLTLIQVGQTSEGRPFYLALVSAAENLANLDRYKEISQRLAHPDGMSDDEARRLARQGKAIVHIDGAVHATEVACAQHTIQLAYDLITGDDDPEIGAILDQVILVLWPTLNPDGQNMVAAWYASNLGTPYEIAPLPKLYQKYVGHDNNRDAYMLNMVESRVVSRTWRGWEPQIVYTQHQTAPFPTRIWLPPFAEPIGSQVHPLMSRTVNSIGMLMAQALEERGQIGATHMGTGFDAWYPGYVDYLPMLRNTAAFWTETALYRYATPHFYTVRDFPERRRTLRSESLYPSPWKGGWWRLADAVAYMLTTSTATLDYAAKFKYDLLYNRYQAGRDTIRKYRKEPPFAYFVPRRQRDPVAPVELLRRLAFAGIRVYELERDVQHEGIDYSAGTWVVPMDQEFAELARQVLEVQTYPDLREFPEGPLEQPYDAAGWTLPMQMDVRILEARMPLAEEIRLAAKPVQGTAVDWSAGELAEDAAPFDSVPGIGFNTDAVAAGVLPSPGEVTGSGPSWAIEAAQLNAYRAINRAWDSGARVSLEIRDGNNARFLVQGLDESSQASLVKDLHLRAERTQPAGVELSRPRIGLYKPWTANMDEGWTRWILEQYDFRFRNLRDAELRAGDLRERFDVIVLADSGRASFVEGFAEGTVPPRYAGGMGRQGVLAMERFVKKGGTLICLNGAGAFAIREFHLAVENVVADLQRQDFFGSGSILEVQVNPNHPVMAGMPSPANIFFNRSPVFTTTAGFRGRALAQYAGQGSPLRSGYLLGEKYLQRHAAALDVRHGDGYVLLLGFRPQWRGQPFGTFRILFNALHYHGAMTAMGEGGEPFWTPPPARLKDEEENREKKKGKKDSKGNLN